MSVIYWPVTYGSVGYVIVGVIAGRHVRTLLDGDQFT
jgi:hypothetical protein